MITEQECKEMLMKIFPPKQEPIASELPFEMQEIVRIAQDMGLEDIPTIVLDDSTNHIEWGKVDFHTYARTTIVIFTNWKSVFDGIIPLTMEQKCRTLAHELGHWNHITTTNGGTYESSGFRACEDWADAYRDRIMERVS